MHIPEKSSEIHGIRDEDVKDSPTFNEVAKSVAKDLEGYMVAGSDGLGGNALNPKNLKETT